MALRQTYKDLIVTVISYLYILLFVYAAVSKILDFENFQAQLGQSPLISAHTGIISYGVLATELAISVLLAIPRFRLFALYASFCLMAMFTIYIALILTYSANIPCSCGGILEKMGWREHLIFNVGFAVLAVIGILISPIKESTNYINSAQ